MHLTLRRAQRGTPVQRVQGETGGCLRAERVVKFGSNQEEKGSPGLELNANRSPLSSPEISHSVNSAKNRNCMAE